MRLGRGGWLQKVSIVAIIILINAVSLATAASAQSQAPSVALSASQNPAVYGGSVSYSVVVSAGTVPTGTVTLYDSGSSVGTVTLDTTGSATLALSTLAAGNHLLSARYNGDSTYLSSTSATLTETITTADPVLTLVSSNNPSAVGGTVQFTVTLASGSTGAVVVQDGQTVIETDSIPTIHACSANGYHHVCLSWSYIVEVPSLSAGTHIVSAVYSGDSNFNPSTVSVTQVVSGTPATPTIVVTPSAAQIPYDGPVTVTAIVSTTPSGGQSVPDATASGSMTFTGDVDGDLAVVPVVQGVATFTTSSLSVGSSTISAEYSGDGSHTPAQGAAPLSVVQADPSMVFGVSPNPGSDSFSFVLSVNMPVDSTGTLTFLDGATALGSRDIVIDRECFGWEGCVLISAGARATAELGSGIHNLVATYSGDINYNSATSNASLTVGAVSPGTGISATITWAQPSPIAYGTALDSAELNAVLSVPGSCVYSPAAGTILPAGTQTLSVTCTPTDTTDYSALTDTVLLAVNQATPTITVASSANPSSVNQSVTFTANLPTDATGTVQFQVDGSNISDPVALSSGLASFSIATLVAGSHTVSAVYSGNANYLVGNGTLTQIVNASVVPPSTVSPTLTETLTAVTNSVNLSGQGTADWMLFAPIYSESIADRKKNVGQMIPVPTLVGTTASYNGFIPSGLFSFTDGTPDSAETNISPFELVNDPQSGFSFAIPAGTTVRTFCLYASAEGNAPVLTASLSDNSVAPVTDSTFLSSTAAPQGGIQSYCMTYNAASAGQTLNVQVVLSGGGALFLHAATLSGSPIPMPPQVSSIQPTYGVAGDSVTLTGLAFTAQQGSVTISNIPAQITSWSDTQIVTIVPQGVSTGAVQVINAAGASNSNVIFTVRPNITAVTPSIGAVGSSIRITGSGFGNAQSPGAVTINGIPAIISTWSDSEVDVLVPPGATSGSLVVLQNGIPSNAVPFLVEGSQSAAPLLTLTVTDTRPRISVSDPANFDWMVWGADGTTTATTRRAGANLISDPLAGASSSLLLTNCRSTFLWNGGSPIETGKAVGSCVNLTTSDGNIVLTAPAGPSVSTLLLYVQDFGVPTFAASLSDGSAPALIDTSVNGPSYVGEEKTYAFSYRAASPGQQLTLVISPGSGGVNLEAAVLQPHLPTVALLSPSDGQVFSFPANVPLGLVASQYDTNIASTSFIANGSSVFSGTVPPYSGVWQPAPGHYRFDASAVDSGGLQSETAPTNVDVIGTGGSLTESLTEFEQDEYGYVSTDLTTEGTGDWIIFPPPAGWTIGQPDDWQMVTADGSYTGVIRKAGVTPLISRAREFGQGEFFSYTGTVGEGFQFEDGTPDPSNSKVENYLAAFGAQSGYEFKVQAGITPRTLRVHAAVTNAQAQIKAYLSDGSAPVITDTSFQSSGSLNGVYAITYHAASENQVLTVRMSVAGTPSANDPMKGVYLYAATLDGKPIPLSSSNPPASVPVLSVSSPASGTTFQQRLITIQGTVTDSNSSISWVWCASGVNFAHLQGNNFTCQVELVGAENNVTITAGDKAGNTSSTSVSLSFLPAIGESVTGRIITPNQLNMLVGDTHNLNWNLTAGVPESRTTEGDCGWYSSDTSVATISATDCDHAIVTAVSPGTAEIIASDAGAKISVYGGTSLPSGTVQWSVPSTLGTINEITPQPPYTPTQGTAPAMYAREGKLYVTAFASDGTQLWQSQKLAGDWNPAFYTHPLVPDFQGNLLLPYPNIVGGTEEGMQKNPQGLAIYDATTGAGGGSAYTYQNGALQHFGPGFYQYAPQAAVIPSPDGTYYIADPPYVKALDSTSTGCPVKFSVAISGCSGGQNVHTGKMILAGDGALYVPFGDYTTSTNTDSDGNTVTSYPCNRVGVMRVTSDGQYRETPLRDFPPTKLSSAQALNGLSMISNADQGAYIAFSDYSMAKGEDDSTDPPTPAVPPTAYLATVSEDGASVMPASAVESGLYTISLQATDGSIVGSMLVDTACADGSSGCSKTVMFRMNSGGGITQSIDNAKPSYALSDGSIVANGGQTTYDASGNITATSPYSVTVDWYGNLTATDGGQSGSSQAASRSHAMNDWALPSFNGVTQSTAMLATGAHTMDLKLRPADVNSGGGSSISALSGYMELGAWFAGAGGGATNSGVATNNPQFPQLYSCTEHSADGSYCTGPREAIWTAQKSLVRLLAIPSCSAVAQQQIFDKFQTTTTSFINYILFNPGFYNGPTSKFDYKDARCPDHSCTGSNPPKTIADMFNDNDTGATAITVSPSEPFKSFWRPSFKAQEIWEPQGCTRGINCIGTWPGIGISVDSGGANLTNESNVLHEALHGMTGKGDATIMTKLGIVPQDDTYIISLFIRNNVLNQCQIQISQ